MGGACSAGGNGEARARKARAMSRLDGVDSTFCLTSGEMRKLWRVFAKIDADKSGEISLLELLDYLQQDNNGFMSRVFSIFDEDRSGEVCFREFVMTLYNYCTLNKSTLILFAFDLYDADGSGAIDHTEVQLLLKEVYGQHFDSSPHASHILRKIGGEDGGGGGGDGLGAGVTPHAFDAFCRKHPALLFPAFQFQQVLRKRVLGAAFWERAAAKRLAGRDGRRRPQRGDDGHGKRETLGEALAAELSSSAFDVLVAAAAAEAGDAGAAEVGGGAPCNGDASGGGERAVAAGAPGAATIRAAGLRDHIGPIARRRLSKGSFAREAQQSRVLPHQQQQQQQQQQSQQQSRQQKPRRPGLRRRSSTNKVGCDDGSAHKKMAWDGVAQAGGERPRLHRRFSTGLLQLRPQRGAANADCVISIAEEEQHADEDNNSRGNDQPRSRRRSKQQRRRSVPNVSALATSAARTGWQ
jgi:Ca2+-binding EF-hand superfamily protein